jgi:ABC-type protease/lipase transport system fused ATPase/permease subunit
MFHCLDRVEHILSDSTGCSHFCSSPVWENFYIIPFIIFFNYHKHRYIYVFHSFVFGITQMTLIILQCFFFCFQRLLRKFLCITYAFKSHRQKILQELKRMMENFTGTVFFCVETIFFFNTCMDYLLN